VTYGLVAASLSAWMSNTATAAMLVPIALSLLAFMETEGRTPPSYGTALMLMTTYGTSRGGMSTPVGTPPNLIAVGMLAALAGVQISFLEWMMVAVPLSLTLLAIVTSFLIYVGGVGPGEIRGVDKVLAERARELGPMRRGERNALIAFGVTVVLWVGPGLLPLVLGAENDFARQVARILPESVAALIGAVLLFFLPVSDTQRSTLTWKEAAQIDWGTLLLFGGGLALGTLAGSTGLAEAIGRGVTNVFPADSTLGLAFAAAVFAVLLSETMSNTAAANIAVPVVISIALAAGIDPVAPALTAALAASVADALPVSTPPNAIVYATGKVPITLMVRYGVVLDGSATIVVPALVVLFSWLLL
jgi:sodium-dependent dicarboxylate transporter 2/3/5